MFIDGKARNMPSF